MSDSMKRHLERLPGGNFSRCPKADHQPVRVTGPNYILSIIIPVYRVESYIEECLDSVFSQLPASVEVVIVNDGTPDHSAEIIESKYSEWLVEDRVVLIEQENAGPGAARNAGVSRARGRYVGFLDGDDVFLEGYFRLIVEILEQYDIDIIEFGFKRFYDSSDRDRKGYRPFYRFTGMRDLAEVRNQVFAVTTWYPGTRVYKKAIFDEIRFPVGVFYEDTMTISRIYQGNLSVFFLAEPLYGYRFNPNSTTSLHTRAHATDMYRFYTSLTASEHTVPTAILRIRTARTIVYFRNELGKLDFSIEEILKDMRKMEKRWAVLKAIKFPDLFFFMFPATYLWVDYLRLNLR